MFEEEFKMIDDYVASINLTPSKCQHKYIKNDERYFCLRCGLDVSDNYFIEGVYEDFRPPQKSTYSNVIYFKLVLDNIFGVFNVLIDVKIPDEVKECKSLDELIKVLKDNKLNKYVKFRANIARIYTNIYIPNLPPSMKYKLIDMYIYFIKRFNSKKYGRRNVLKCNFLLRKFFIELDKPEYIFLLDKISPKRMRVLDKIYTMVFSQS